MRSPAPEFWDAVVIESFKMPFMSWVPLFWPCWSLVWISVGIVCQRSFKRGVHIGYGVYYQTFLLILILIDLLKINRAINWLLYGNINITHSQWLEMVPWWVALTIFSPFYVPALVMVYKYYQYQQLPKKWLMIFSASIFCLSSLFFSLLAMDG